MLEIRQNVIGVLGQFWLRAVCTYENLKALQTARVYGAWFDVRRKNYLGACGVPERAQKQVALADRCKPDQNKLNGRAGVLLAKHTAQVVQRESSFKTITV